MLESLTTTKYGETANTRPEDEGDLDVALAILYQTVVNGVLIHTSVFHYAGGSAAGGSLLPGPAPADFVDITAERAARIREFIPLIRQARNNRAVGIAMRRHISARRRQYNEAAFIDSWIALESLFGTGGTELTFRMSLRIAAFLESEPGSRIHRFDSARAAYEMRSKLVHGEHKSPTREVVNAADEMVRLSLYKICYRPTSYNVAVLEREILSGREIATEGMTLVPPLPEI
jgi:hypothetical protein